MTDTSATTASQSKCTCTQKVVRYPANVIPAWEFLHTVRDRDCPLHGNAVIFNPLANMKAALAVWRRRGFSLSSLGWTKQRKRMDNKYGQLFTKADVVKIVERMAKPMDAAHEVEEALGSLGTEAGSFTFPVDEPLFLLRGKDKACVPTIRAYTMELNRLLNEREALLPESHPRQLEQAELKKHMVDASKQAMEIADWQHEHPDRVKIPD